MLIHIGSDISTNASSYAPLVFRRILRLPRYTETHALGERARQRLRRHGGALMIWIKTRRQHLQTAILSYLWAYAETCSLSLHGSDLIDRALLHDKVRLLNASVISSQPDRILTEETWTVGSLSRQQVTHLQQRGPTASSVNQSINQSRL